MATFVLVHGAWHGGWCYARVARILRAAGHLVHTPTLTGLGERSHLAHQEINLDTHIRDIVNLCEYEDLNGVILCGHSYGGMVITGVAAEIAPRIACLVYLDAIVPQTGQSFFDITFPEHTAQFLALAARNGGRVPPMPAALFQLTGEDAALVDAKCTPHPLATFAQAVRLGADAVQVARRIFVLAATSRMEIFQMIHDRLQQTPGWAVHTIACGHEVMIERPQELAALLLAAA